MSGAYSWQSVRRYPLGPVLEVLRTRGLTATEMYDATGLHGSSWKAAVENGLIPKAADRVATRIGRHPMELWPSWDRDAAEDEFRRNAKRCAECGELFLPYRSTQKFCGRVCGNRNRTRLWHRKARASSPEMRRREAERQARYRAELSQAAARAAAVKRRQATRAWEAANIDRVRARKNEWKRRKYATDADYRERVLEQQRQRDRAKARRMDEAA